MALGRRRGGSRVAICMRLRKRPVIHPTGYQSQREPSSELRRCCHVLTLPLPSSDRCLWGLSTRLQKAEALRLFSALQRIRPSLFQEFSRRTNAHREKEHTEITACSPCILQKFLASCICGNSGTASALTSPDLPNSIKGPHLNRSLLAEGVKFRGTKRLTGCLNHHTPPPPPLLGKKREKKNKKKKKDIHSGRDKTLWKGKFGSTYCGS